MTLLVHASRRAPGTVTAARGKNAVLTVVVTRVNEPVRILFCEKSVADPGGRGGHDPPPSPVKISHKKDGCQIRPQRFHVFRPPSTRPLDPLLEVVILYHTTTICHYMK